jgi:hypothetical protein
MFVGRVDDIGPGEMITKSFTIIVPHDKLKAALSLKTLWLKLEPVGKNTYSLGGVNFSPVDGRFPDFRRVLPPSDFNIPEAHCQIEPSYYVDAEKALLTWSGAKPSKAGVNVVTRQSGQHMYVQVLADRSAIVKIMGCTPGDTKITGFYIPAYVPTPVKTEEVQL